MYDDNPTLQQMINAAIRGSQLDGLQKIAQEAGEIGECEKCSSPTIAGSKYCKECAQKENKMEETGEDTQENEKTSSVYLGKLASAVTQIVGDFGNLDWSEKIAFPSPQIAGASPITSPTSGPGVGPGALQTTKDSPTIGVQSEETGEAKHNKPAMNPVTGTGANPNSASTAMADNMNETTTPPYPEEGVMKQGSVENFFKRALLKKIGADSENPASISGPKNTTLPEDQPSQMSRPPEVVSQERLIASNEAAINATKREAKEVPKKRMGEVLSEPMQSAATNKVLEANLGKDVVSESGAKIAAKVLLQKIASQGCQCEDGSQKGGCDYCKLASRLGHLQGRG